MRAEAVAAVEAGLAALDTAVPNLAVMLAVNGEVLVERKADVELCACSTGKVAAGAAVMALVQDGLVDLDTPASEIDGRLRFADAERGGRITLRMLLSHTSGLTDTDRVETDPIACLPQLRHAADPGRTFLYSNVAFDCGIEAAARVAGMAPGALLQSRVFDPLGMASARPTDRYGDPSGWQAFGATARDLMRLANEMLGDHAVLEHRALHEMQRVHGDSWAASGTRYYGLGLCVEQWGNLTLYSHGGGLGTYGSAFVVDPMAKAAFVAMFDNPAGYGANGIALLDRVLGRTTSLGPGRAFDVDWRDYLGRYANGAELFEKGGAPHLNYGPLGIHELEPFDERQLATVKPVAAPGMTPRKIGVGLLEGDPVMTVVNHFPPIGARPGRRL